MKFGKKSAVIFGLTIALLAGGALITNQSKRDTDQQSTKVERGTLREELTLAGEIDAEEKVNLVFQTLGRLSYVGVKEGDTVKKGQLIAQLDQRDVQKNLEKELNDFLNERWDLDEERDKTKNKALTDAMQRAIDKAQFDVNSAILDVELKNIAVEFSKLISPIDGVITRVDTPTSGVNVKALTEGFEIINPDTLYFVAVADQTELSDITEGSLVEVVLDAFPEDTLGSTVSTISLTPKADETGAVYEVKIAISTPEISNKLRLGMTGDATFVIRERKNTLFVPFGYVKQDNGESFVTIKKNGKLVKQKVKTGIETEDSIEILSGLKEGDLVYD